VTSISRRTALTFTAGTATGLLAACGGGEVDSVEATEVDGTQSALGSNGRSTPVLKTTPTTTTNVLAPTGKYRFQHPLLFQRAHQRVVKASYVNSLGQTVYLPKMDHAFVGYDGVHDTSTNTRCGSDYTQLCTLSAWTWKNYGGDWLDNSTPTRKSQGATPWATTAAIPNGTLAGEVEVDVSKLIQYCDQNKRWYAMFIMVSGGQFKLNGPCNTTAAKSVLEIVRGKTSETKTLWYACTLIQTAYTNAQDDVLVIDNDGRAVMEFYRPEDQSVVATSAKLRLRHGGVSYGNPVVKIFMVDPTLPDLTQQTVGLAAGYALDNNILSHANVAAALRVTDSTVIEDVLDVDYVVNKGKSWAGGQALSLKTESMFDPYLWGTPGQGALAKVAVPSAAQLTQLMPNRGIAKGITKLSGAAAKSTVYGDTVRVVSSAELKTRGLPVLAPGMGALEMIYPSMNIKPGQAHPQSWTTGGMLSDNRIGPDLEMCFKREHIGRVVDGYMRMYVCLAEGWEADDASMAWHPQDISADRWGKWPEQFGADPNSLPWRATDFSGKFPGGIQQITTGVAAERYNFPTRKNTAGAADTSKVVDYPGNGYGASSGIYGYQGRWQFKQGFYKANFDGPACGGASIALETYDFSQNVFCIPSQAFLGGWDLQNYAGFRYGMGYLRPKRWYCVEMRWKMNTVISPYAEPPAGTHYLESGYVKDGYLEWWVDGVYSSKSDVFAHRNGRLVDWALQNAQGRPFGSKDAMRPMTGVPADAYMGATTAILQCYYGGRSALMKDMKVLLNGIVVSNGAYIGPMKGVSRENGGIGGTTT
jgi:hypothetical protein